MNDEQNILFSSPQGSAPLLGPARARAAHEDDGATRQDRRRLQEEGLRVNTSIWRTMFKVNVINYWLGIKRIKSGCGRPTPDRLIGWLTGGCVHGIERGLGP
jgi:hypothetical protein